MNQVLPGSGARVPGPQLWPSQRDRFAEAAMSLSAERRPAPDPGSATSGHLGPPRGTRGGRTTAAPCSVRPSGFWQLAAWCRRDSPTFSTCEAQRSGAGRRYPCSWFTLSRRWCLSRYSARYSRRAIAPIRTADVACVPRRVAGRRVEDRSRFHLASGHRADLRRGRPVDYSAWPFTWARCRRRGHRARR